ncbi:MAG: transporter substrate-binding domain-containing protein [Gammaproteobacteria bacterium]|jgi:polar amino acid transport system substrate-binding protein
MAMTIMFKFTLFMSLMLTLTYAQAEQPRELGVTASFWSPYVNHELPDNGFAVNLVMTALERAGYKPSFEMQQWPNDLEGTQQGRYDVIASIWYTKERTRELVFSQPIIENRVKLMVRTDSNIQIPNPREMKGYRVGVVEDYAYTQGAYADLPVDFVKMDTVEENLQQLLAGKIDIAVADERVALYVMNNRIPGSIKQIRFVESNVSTRGLRIAVTRKRPDAEQIISDFENAFQGMKDDGTYVDILLQFRVSQ